MIATPAGCRIRPARPLPLGIAIILLAGCWLGGLAVLAADKIPNSDCLLCHSDETLTKTNAAGKEVSLFVDESRFKSSVHGTNTCSDCHPDITSGHPDDNVPAQPPACAKCHEQSAEQYATSIHGVSHKLVGIATAPTIWCRSIKWTHPSSSLTCPAPAPPATATRV